jgi:3-dehydroquinate synthase
METFTINTSGKTSKILVGGSIAGFADLVPPQTIVITDKVVFDLYGKHWDGYKTVVIGQGEKNKTIATVEDIFRQLLDFGLDRSGFILGIGGGIVCDIAGFVASTYLRGIRFGFVPTTLLAQVDASIGGKNGVNFLGYKNIIGTFNQPEFILSDPSVLKTLPAEECSNGFAEIVKHALIADEEMFRYIENHITEMLALKSHAINHLIKRSVEIKSGIVNRDEREKGERRKLNFGHTFGHAIEKVSGISHGKAVSLGSVIASRLSMKKGYLKDYDFERILNVLENLNLPVKKDFNREEIFSALLRDKKREQESIHFILLANIGRAIVEQMRVDEIQKIEL